MPKNNFFGGNLLERSAKKRQERGKLSYSASMRRLDGQTKLLNPKCGCNEVIDYFNNIRREPEMSTNANSINENTLQIMLKSYKEKEKQWLKEKQRFENEMTCLKEELKAIRSFICTQSPTLDSCGNRIKETDTPVPAFIRA